MVCYRGKAFLFQDGDANAKVPNIGSKKVEEAYRKAMEEAKVIHEQLIIERAIAKDRDNNGRNLKPPPYVKLKVELTRKIPSVYLLILLLIFKIYHYSTFVGQ